MSMISEGLSALALPFTLEPGGKEGFWLRLACVAWNLGAGLLGLAIWSGCLAFGLHTGWLLAERLLG